LIEEGDIIIGLCFRVAKDGYTLLSNLAGTKTVAQWALVM
jgi:hypothetical protein